MRCNPRRRIVLTLRRPPTERNALCTGSRIENTDGTCRSTGGFTTDTTGLLQGSLISQMAGEISSALKSLAPAPTVPFDGSAGSPIGSIRQAASNAISDVDRFGGQKGGETVWCARGGRD